MTSRQKCAQCGILAIFQDDFCTSCWSHRKKGKVLTEEQIAACKKQMADANEKKLWQAELEKWQNWILLPSILMTLWYLYAASVLLPVLLRIGAGKPDMAVCFLGAAVFAGGGYLVGGSKALRIACPLLIVASVLAMIHIGDFLINVVPELAERQSDEKIAKGMLFGSIRLVLCGVIIFSAIKILRLKRPGA
ncbi:hypothetical protein [Prosthecobacter sp.]|uniref:hypothetical protein n=1 Tax=Prosthecobacter sp. TaxID=1965333 RepID=UPI0037832791